MSKKPAVSADQAADASVDQVPAAVVPQVNGLALVDIPEHGLRCGEYAALPQAVADSLAAAGEFDRAAAPAV